MSSEIFLFKILHEFNTGKIDDKALDELIVKYIDSLETNNVDSIAHDLGNVKQILMDFSSKFAMMLTDKASSVLRLKENVGMGQVEVRYLSKKEAADYLKVHVNSLTNYVKKGKLEANKVSRKKVLFSQKELDRFVGDSK